MIGDDWCWMGVTGAGGWTVSNAHYTAENLMANDQTVSRGSMPCNLVTIPIS